MQLVFKIWDIKMCERRERMSKGNEEEMLIVRRKPGE